MNEPRFTEKHYAEVVLSEDRKKALPTISEGEGFSPEVFCSDCNYLFEDCPDRCAQCGTDMKNFDSQLGLFNEN